MGKKLKQFIDLEFDRGETYKTLSKKSGIKAGTIFKMRETGTTHDLESYLKAMAFWKQPLEGVVDDEILEKYGIKKDPQDEIFSDIAPYITPKDKIIYSQRVFWGKEIEKSWPGFSEICGHFFAIYRSNNNIIINTLQNVIRSLSGQLTGYQGVERRKKPLPK